MINIGLYCLRSKLRDPSEFYFMEVLPLLGYFGVSHGISEWISLVNLTKIYSEVEVYLYHFNQILKASHSPY